MSMGYAYKHGHISEVPKGASDPSPAGLQQRQVARQGARVDQNGNMKRQSDYGRGTGRNDNSPIPSVSPPQSSASSELLSHSGSCHHHDSDVYRSEISRCSHHASNGSYCTQSSQKPGSLLANSPDSILVSSRSVDGALMFANGSSEPDGKAMIQKLHELESVLMGDVDDADMADLLNKNGGTWEEILDDFCPTNQAGPSLKHLAISEETQRQRDGASDGFFISRQPPGSLYSGNHVKNLLMTCAAAISEERKDVAELAMQDLKSIVSVYGGPLERLAAYVCEGLVARLATSGFSIYKALKCREPPAVEVLSAMQKLYEICPYIKFAYMAANGAIAEAFKDEAMVHIFDFQIDQGTQWVSLIHALASRPGGKPHIRISTVDDPTARSYPLGGMHVVKTKLANLASALGVPFEFTTISTKLSDLQAHMIERRPGEALAMNFALQLHHMPDEGVCLDNPRDRLLRMAKSLNPKVLTLVEQDANTNTAPFMARFMETWDYYSAVFESIDVALPRESKERVNVEEHCLARDIVNVIACEGVQRVERHELAGKWRARMLMAGFRPHSLSLYVNNTIKSLLESYNEKYKLKEDGVVLLLGWLNRPLVAASAWH
eukprot:c23388_g1_i2 orf=639-2459(-)